MIRCTLYQWQVRRSDDPARTLAAPHQARHLRDCPACRTAANQLLRLEEQLGADTADRLSPAQHARIRTAVQERLRRLDTPVSHPLRSARRHRPALTAAIFAAAAMLMLAAGVFVSLHRRPLEVRPEPMTFASLWDDYQSLTRQFPQLAALPEQAMQTEMTKLANDTQRAVAFLLACAPSHPLPETDNGL